MAFGSPEAVLAAVMLRSTKAAYKQLSAADRLRKIGEA
jgi:hypothetical protein